MLTTIIKLVIQYRFIVIGLFFITTIISVASIKTASLDALPDISDSQIIIYAKWSRSPEQLENKITNPIIQSLLGMQNVKNIRATSHLGYSFIYVVFQNSQLRNEIRQQVTDKLNAIRPQLPADADISLGPNASSMGWIYQYALIDETKTHDLRELKHINETLVKPFLQPINGIAEVAMLGGLDKQIDFKIFPPLLAKNNVTLREIITTLNNAFQQVGGRTIELTNRDYQLRAVIDTSNLDALEFLVIKTNDSSEENEAVLLKDIGYFQVNYDLRRGIADLNGEGEVVGGIVIMEQDQNVLSVTQELESKLAIIEQKLPAGISIVTTYNRSSLIWETLKNFSTALLYELLVVIFVVIWALKNGRAAVAPVLIILLGCLYTLLSMSMIGQTINLLSLAGLAIAIGEMADATIVIIEDCKVKLSKLINGKVGSYDEQRHRIIVQSISRMMRPLLFSLFIILVSFIPVFFLNDREGLLFDPLAYSKTFAMFFSTILTLFLLPIIIVWVFNGKTIIPKKENAHSLLIRIYSVMLVKAIKYRYLFLSLSLISLVSSVLIMSSFQKNYLPEMDEGSLLYMPTTLPALPIREAGWVLQEIDKKIKAFPEVARVFGKLGRADTSTDPAPITMIESTILLKPKSQWRKGMTKEKLVDEMNKALNIIGYVNSWTQPIAGRVIMQASGIQTPVGIKVKGFDIFTIEKISKEIETVLKNIPQTDSVIAERITEGYYVDVEHNLMKLAEHGVTVDEVNLTLRYGVGGENIFYTKINNQTVPLSMQYSPEYIDTLEKVKQVQVVTADGQNIPLQEIADVNVKKMPEMLRNDDGMLAGYIYINTKNVTPIDYVEIAKQVLNKHINLPQGYSLEWTGTHHYAEEAESRLFWIIPLTLIIMLILLMLAFKSVGLSFVILVSAPFALVGGVLLQWVLGEALTTAVIIGYIAVLAIAIQTAIIMVEFIRDELNKSNLLSHTEKVIKGSVLRLRPKLMTVATTVLGLLPIVFLTGSGLDVTRPIAIPSMGGMVSSAIYVLFLIPCLFVIGEDIKIKSKKKLKLC